MKKEYKKPRIYSEEFILSNSIAASCNAQGERTSGSAGSCAFYPDGTDFVVFSNSVSACIDKVDENMDWICYNTPNGQMVIFSN